ncbi:MAG: hypothetical protein KGL35_31395 [Bradyrhizobium sp.]|nr:hypothetical protein [Bradyrhizobium sp.]
MRVTLAKQADGTFAGEMTIGHCRYLISDWRLSAPGVVDARVSYPPDPEWDAMIDRLDKITKGG